MNILVSIPVYNEQQYVRTVLDEIRRFSNDILVIDDGSTDDTPLLLARQPVEVIRHAVNRGYGRSIQDAFRWAQSYGYDWLITIDCDEQHEPASLPDFYDRIKCGDTDVISGSRYLDAQTQGSPPPPDRRHINTIMTQTINDHTDLQITDAFCGFKAYRVNALKEMTLTESGYAFPMQFWVQAAAYRLQVVEIPIRLIYKDANRSFGEFLDNPAHRLAHYQNALDCELAKFPEIFARRHYTQWAPKQDKFYQDISAAITTAIT